MSPFNSEILPGLSAPLSPEGIRTWKRPGFLRLSRLFCGPSRVVIGFFLSVAVVFVMQLESARAQTATESATYTVTFEGNWSLDSTPGGVVGGAHFTTLIGAVHNSGVSFWRPGGMATPGVELVAEIGGTSMFKSEISAKGADVKSTVEAGGTSATGMSTFEVEFSRTHSLLTLLSMIGPSPDWFVGVSGRSLLDGSNWRSSLEVNLFPYDAGTEDGEEFLLSNDDTVPQGIITSIRGQGKFTNTRMARLSFTLKTPQPSPPTTPPSPSPPTEEEVCAVSDVTDDRNLRRFVECAAKRIEASTFEDVPLILEEFRDGEGNWNDGSTYLIILTEGGRVYFHANDREVEEMDWSGILFCEGGVPVPDTQEGCFIEYGGERRGYAHPFSASHLPPTQGEDEFVLLGGSDEIPGREPSAGETDGSSTETGGMDADGGGGCDLGENDSASAFCLFLAALALLLAGSLGSAGGFAGSRQILMPAAKLSCLPKRNKAISFLW